MAYDWDEFAEHWEEDPVTGLFAEKVYKSLLDQTTLIGKRVFEIGCGTGLLCQKMSVAAKDIVALDSSELMIEELDKKCLPNVEPVVDKLTRGLIAQHPAFRGQFDCIVAASVCAYIDNYSEVSELVYSLLEEDGVFLHWDFWDDTDQEGLSVETVQKTLSDAGFHSVYAAKVFEIDTEKGTLPVILGVGRKLVQ